MAAAVVLGTAAPGRAFVDADDGFALRLGFELGVSRVSAENFWDFDFNFVLRYRTGPFSLRADMWVPLRLSMKDWSFRTADWQTAHDYYSRLGRCVRLDLGDFAPPPDRYDNTCADWGWDYDRADERVYFTARLQPLEGLSFGNGTLVYQYRNSVDPALPQLGVMSHFVLKDWGDVRGFLDDVGQPHLVGGRLSFRPLQLFFGQKLHQENAEWELGGTVVTDLHAPAHVETAFGQPLADGRGSLRYTGTNFTAAGADMRFRYVWGLRERLASQVGLQVTADYNRFLEVDNSDGVHAGFFFVFMSERQSRTVIPWEVQLGGQYRYFGNRYLPEYFDGNYLAQSQQYATTRDAAAAVGAAGRLATKVEYLQSRATGYTHGGQGFVRVVIPVPTGVGGTASAIHLSAFVEDATGPANASAGLTFGPWQIDRLSVAASYLRRNFDSLKNMFQLDGTMIRAIGLFQFGYPDRRGRYESFWHRLSLALRYDRRFFLRPEDLRYTITQDVVFTIGIDAWGV